MSSILPGIGPLPPGPLTALPTGPARQQDGEGFGGVLRNALAQVDELNTGAEQQIGNMLNGGNSDLSSVMVAVEKADVAFQLMMQVRNKIVSAYQDVERMQF